MENVGQKAQTKFKTVFLSEGFEYDDKINELISWCNKFSEQGLCPSYGQGSFGNLSYRTENNKFIITASALELKDKLSAKDFVLVEKIDIESFTLFCRGIKVPSSESILHYEIYNKRKDVNAIFHGHCEAILKNSRKYICTSHEEEYGSKALVDRVIEVLDNNSFVIMKNHGFIAMGHDMTEAGEIAIEKKSQCPNPKSQHGVTS